MENAGIKIEYKSLSELKPYDRNPRNNEESVELVANSIHEFGFKVPIIVDRNNVIVAGHTRFLAARRLGIENVPCITADDLSEDQVRAFRLADNKVAERSEWDFGLLDTELLDLEEVGFDMELFGFESFDEEEQEKKKERERNLERMELRAFEHHDYIVFVFDNQMDWLNVVSEFGLKKVNGGYGTTKKIGLGRVIHGKELLERLKHKDIDNQQEQE